MEDIRSNLEQLGFSPNESRVFLVLMQGKTMTAGEIAEEAGVSRPSAYDILKSFTEKGFCNEIETPTKLWYEVIDPDIVSDKLEREISNTYKKRMGHLESSVGKLKELYKSSSNEQRHLDIELIRGFNKHRSAKFAALLGEAEKEILLMNSLEGNISKEQDDAAAEFFKKGGSFRAIYELDSKVKIKIEDKWVQLDKKGFLDLCEDFERGGVQTKLTDKIPQNMMIIDRKTVFLNIVNKDKTKSDLIIRNEQYAELMAGVFDNLWNASKTIREARN
jgi:sugar-specific transcriptional regulator TrmB